MKVPESDARSVGRREPFRVKTPAEFGECLTGIDLEKQNEEQNPLG